MSVPTADALMGIFGLKRAGVAVVVPVKTENPLNGSHRHWRVRSAARKRQRHAAYALCPAHPLPVTVRLVRLSAGELDDDNLRAALKAVRDGVADRLGVADNDPRVRWQYAQERCKRGTYGVRLELMAQGGAANEEVG
jgi:hypothetical protein